MKILIEAVISFVFERVPVLNWLNGNKRLIGNVLLLIGALLEAARSAFPDNPLVSEGIAYFTIVAGAITRVIGDMHAQAKENKFGR
jgi:hypothetical protein